MKLYDDPAVEKTIWKVRESGLGADGLRARAAPTLGKAGRTRPCGRNKPGKIPARTPQAARQIRLQLLALRPLRPGLRSYAHRLRSGHARRNPNISGVHGRSGRFGRAHGGSLSGEHGDGQVARPNCCRKMYGDTIIRAFEEFKAIWDPALENESRQGRAALSRRPELAAGDRLRSARAADPLPMAGRRILVAANESALRGRSAMLPQARRGHDVPQLPRHS